MTLHQTRGNSSAGLASTVCLSTASTAFRQWSAYKICAERLEQPVFNRSFVPRSARRTSSRDIWTRGAAGIIVPHVETVDSARRVVETVRYARPKDHEDKVVVVMIESTAAMENLRDMLTIRGVDVFFIGPNDLSHSMGHPAQIHHPDVKAAVKQAIARIRSADKTAGTLVVAETAAECVCTENLIRL